MKNKGFWKQLGIYIALNVYLSIILLFENVKKGKNQQKNAFCINE